jgi:hypothetical protein
MSLVGYPLGADAGIKPTLFVLIDSSESAVPSGISSQYTTGVSKTPLRTLFEQGLTKAFTSSEVIDRLVACQYTVTLYAWGESMPFPLASETISSPENVLLLQTQLQHSLSRISVVGNGDTDPTSGLETIVSVLQEDSAVLPVVLFLYDGTGYTSATFDPSLIRAIAERGGSVHSIVLPNNEFYSDFEQFNATYLTPPERAIGVSTDNLQAYPDIILSILEDGCGKPGM